MASSGRSSSHLNWTDGLSVRFRSIGLQTPQSEGTVRQIRVLMFSKTILEIAFSIVYNSYEF